MKSVCHHTAHLIDLCVVNFKTYWGANMFTQEQAPKNEWFASCVRGTVAGRNGWPLCLRHKRRWDARELAFTPHSARAALWYSSYDWNKLLKFATKSSCIFFFCEMDGSNTCLPHSCCIKFSDVWEANNKVPDPAPVKEEIQGVWGAKNLHCQGRN